MQGFVDDPCDSCVRKRELGIVWYQVQRCAFCVPGTKKDIKIQLLPFIFFYFKFFAAEPLIVGGGFKISVEQVFCEDIVCFVVGVIVVRGP